MTNTVGGRDPRINERLLKAIGYRPRPGTGNSMEPAEYWIPDWLQLIDGFEDIEGIPDDMRERLRDPFRSRVVWTYRDGLKASGHAAIYRRSIQGRLGALCGLYSSQVENNGVDWTNAEWASQIRERAARCQQFYRALRHEVSLANAEAWSDYDELRAAYHADQAYGFAQARETIDPEPELIPAPTFRELLNAYSSSCVQAVGTPHDSPERVTAANQLIELYRRLDALASEVFVGTEGDERHHAPEYPEDFMGLVYEYGQRMYNYGVHATRGSRVQRDATHEVASSLYAWIERRVMNALGNAGRAAFTALNTPEPDEEL